MNAAGASVPLIVDDAGPDPDADPDADVDVDVPGAAAAPLEPRERILGQALRLMAESGVHATSMRSLATACGLNVATLYHYFPSKRALLTEVIAAQQYDQLLVELPPIDRSLPPTPRLAALLDWIWASMGDHDDMWRLLLSESLRGENDALTAAAELSATFERALEDWLGQLFADLSVDLHVTARVLRGLIYGFLVEMMPLPAAQRHTFLAQRAEEVAAVVIPA